MVKQNRYNRQSRLAATVASGLLAGARYRIGIGRVDAAGDHCGRAIIRAVAAARARMIVHPVGHEAITIDERKQVLRRALMATTGQAQR